MAVIHLNFPSAALSWNTDVNLILPDVPGGVPKGKGYQVLCLLHGTYGDYTDWCRKTAIERYAQANCLAVVMPSGGNSMYQDMAQGPQVKTFLLEELPAYLRSILPLSAKREDNFIAGLSMGGYGAMHLALSRPERYAAAASLSGLFTFGHLARRNGKQPWPMLAVTGGVSPEAIDKSRRNVLVQAKALVNKGVPLPALFLSVGTEDFTLKGNREGVKKLRALGLDPVYEEHPGGHTWEYWDTHIQRVLAFLPLKKGLVDL